MGHASIATTNLYLHHLGTPADRAGLARLNARGHAGAHEKRRGQNDKGRTPPDLARLRWSDGVPVGWRKDDGEVTSPESDVRQFFDLTTQACASCSAAQVASPMTGVAPNTRSGGSAVTGTVRASSAAMSESSPDR